MLAWLVSTVVRACVRARWIVVLLACLLGGLAGNYAVNHFNIDTNSENLLSPHAAWRQTELRYDRAFPQQNNLIVAVIDGATAERAEQAASALAAMLARDRTHFTSVRRPDGGAFFEHEGLLLLPLDTVKDTTDSLIRAQPFLGGLAADPSLRGVMKTLKTTLMGVTTGNTTLASLDKPITALSATINEAAAGAQPYFGWSAMVSGSRDLSRTRRFVEVQPKLDFRALRPGERGTKAIRIAAKKLALTLSHGVRVRLTGQVAMADEEFASITDRGALLASLMIGATLLMLWLALRSVRMIAAILVTIVIGLAITASVGLLVYGTFNVISVAFVVLFVGLGVDFGIQFCVRYRAERHKLGRLEDALAHAGTCTGAGLTLAAVAAALAFYSFLPTNYAGLAQLGMIAGTGMLITYVLSITLLPAWLALFKPRQEVEEIGFLELAPMDRALTENCQGVLKGAAIVGGIALALCPFMHFDADPLDLRDARSESVSTALELMRNPDTSSNTIEVLRPNRDAARQLAAKLSKLPVVGRTLTIDSFIPDQQHEKLAAIRDAAGLLETVFHPFFVAPAATDVETVVSLNDTAAALRGAADAANNPPARHARALAEALQHLARGESAARTRASIAVVPGLKTMLKQLDSALHPSPVRLETLPRELLRDWVSPSGLHRVEVLPANPSPDMKTVRFFTRGVLAVVPDATGTPVIIFESARTIVWSFVEAGALSFASIVVILGIALRRFGDELMTLIPLILAGVLTLATCVVFGIQLNFANIIALPLLFGVGVAFDIYFVMWWREGGRNLLQSPLTRAVLMSAGTTGAAFGTLSLSRHPGTASMGLLLMISLFWILVSMLIVLPALLHRVLPHEGLENTPAE